MTKPKKTTKKYEMSRVTIADEIEAIQDRLATIDTLNSSPSDVEVEISDIRDALESLASSVTDERY